MKRLIDPTYLAFPFRLEAGRPAVATRRQHVREQIEQVLFTNPNERVFRLDFGAGVRRMVFEPNGVELWDLTKQRLSESLLDVLRGEVDPASLQVEIGPSPIDAASRVGGVPSESTADDTLYIRVGYRLATIQRSEQHVFHIAGGRLG